MRHRLFRRAFAPVIALLAAVGTVQAAEVEIVDGNVIRITNLTVILQGEDAAIYNVDFVQDTGFDRYGDDRDNLDFTQEENVSSALQAVLQALNAASPTPVGAGPGGDRQFWIPAEYDDGFYAVVGGEIFGNDVWDQCQTNCIASVRIPPLRSDLVATYADFTLTTGEPTDTTISSSSLPSSRSIQVGGIASAFSTIINTGQGLAEECGLSVLSPAILASEFEFQTVNELNVPIGNPNANADIVEGGAQGFIFWFEPTQVIDPVEVEILYDCANTQPAPVIGGLNTLLPSASVNPVPDIIALLATASNDGIVALSGASGANAFAVAVSNVGSASQITASADVGDLPLVVTVCRTDPASGACEEPTVPDFTATVDIGAGESPTFSFFVTATGDIPFDPALNRIEVTFVDQDSVVRGASTVAVRTQ